jgi:hypothetical protein
MGILDYRSPGKEPGKSMWPSKRFGMISCSGWLLALAFHVGVCLIPLPGGGPRSKFNHHLMCRIPAALSAIGIVIGSIGVVRDKQKVVAILGVILNAVSVFWLLTLDEMWGIDH